MRLDSVVAATWIAAGCALLVRGGYEARAQVASTAVERDGASPTPADWSKLPRAERERIIAERRGTLVPASTPFLLPPGVRRVHDDTVGVTCWIYEVKASESRGFGNASTAWGALAGGIHCIPDWQLAPPGGAL